MKRGVWIRSGAWLAGLCGMLAAAAGSAQDPVARTPIKHLVVIFQENVSFDHYFATYPVAANVPGEPAFRPLPGSPGLPGGPHVETLAAAHLLARNPNSNPINGVAASLPFRLDRTQAATADQDHDYTAEQAAFDRGRMDLFPLYTGNGSKGGAGSFATKGQVMGYYDGNTVTALWHYAQHYAMSDNSFGTTFGPSTPGAINLISGQTNGVILPAGAELEPDGSYAHGAVVRDGAGGWTDIADRDPTGDFCSRGATFAMSGRNIGDLLNAHRVSWGWFEGGFDLTQTNFDGTTGCDRATRGLLTGVVYKDYIPHHAPFQYYASTANPDHVRPRSIEAIGSSADGGANHQYDVTDFYAVLDSGRLPAVSFLKAPAFQDGHAGYSDPLDEQQFLVGTINRIMQSPLWASTAIIILYDDSDGWYDHVHAVVNPSALKGIDVYDVDRCGHGMPLPGVKGVPAGGRCGYGTRQPFLVLSPYAKADYVDHRLIDQTSVLRFIEDNWLGGERIGQGSFDAKAGSIEGMFDFAHGPANPPLLLDPSTGLPS